MQYEDTLKLSNRSKPQNTKKKHDFSYFDNRYRIVRSIGEGGFGKVYLVEDDFHDGDRLALKLIHSKHQQEANFEQRFINEIRILRTLQHPGIPQIFNDGKTQKGIIYYTMTYVEGISLEYILKKYKALPPLQIAQIVRQIISILDYAHSMGVVHRDLKPSNIILSNFGSKNERANILDFGIAKILCHDKILEQAKSMVTQKAIGTPHYMAPEQVQGLEVNARTDLYALGVMIYRMVTGKLPFHGKTSVEIAMAHVLKEPEPIDDGKTPSSLNFLIKKLLSKANKQRPSSQEIHKILDTLSKGHTEFRKVKKKKLLQVVL
jgi:serine/threonine-protein kinase